MDKYVVDLNSATVHERVPVNDDGCLNDDGDVESCCGCGRVIGDMHEYGCDWEPCPLHEHEQILSCGECDNISVLGFLGLVEDVTKALNELGVLDKEPEGET